jgi:broad specificity phosphatase PhoE
MSTLILLRHGQAAAYEPDSDRLTDLGCEQARRVGAHLVAEGTEIDEVWSGSLQRQRHTRDLVGEAFTEAGRTWPTPREDDRWNEYDAPGVLGTLLPTLAAQDETFRGLVAAFHDHAGSPDRNRHFQRMFEVLMDRWRTGAVDAEGVEPFLAFHERVRAVLDDLMGAGGSRTVLVVTSGGPIGATVQTVLEAPAEVALRLNWRVRNASLTEMIFSRGRISLESFNGVAHFEQRLRTFR